MMAINARAARTSAKVKARRRRELSLVPGVGMLRLDFVTQTIDSRDELKCAIVTLADHDFELAYRVRETVGIKTNDRNSVGQTVPLVLLFGNGSGTADRCFEGQDRVDGE